MKVMVGLPGIGNLITGKKQIELKVNEGIYL